MAAIELASTTLFSDGSLNDYWKLENVNDSKGAVTFTNNNSVAFNAAKFNNGADFGSANTNKYLGAASALNIAGNGDCSFVFWVKMNTEIASGSQTFFTFGSQTTADRYLNCNYNYNGGTRQIEADFAGTKATGNFTLGNSAFHHIGITRNVSGNTGIIYVDGVQLATSALGTTVAGASRFYLGFDAGSTFASCIIDDVAAFSRVLTPTEISTLALGVINTTGGAFLLNFC